MLVLVVVAACGKKAATLDRGEVEQKVGAEAAKLVGVKTAGVTCPADIKPAAGASFTCAVKFQGGGTLTFKVSQTNDTGSLAVAADGDWLLGDTMEKDLVTELFLIGHPEATVECGDAVMPIKLPGQVQCTVKKAGTAVTKVAVAVDASRNVEWKLVGGP
ncbi:MAG TPA: DUF4333 domain-containing protein [Kofleriaceae bacterium]